MFPTTTNEMYGFHPLHTYEIRIVPTKKKSQYCIHVKYRCRGYTKRKHEIEMQ